MKKLVKVILVLSMLMLVITGCGEEASQTAETTAKQNDGATETTVKQSDETAEATDEEMVVGFIYVGPIGDGGWTYSHDQGRLALEEELGVKTIYKESVPESQEVEGVIKDMIDQGATVIFATSYGYMDYVEALSADFPEVKFFHCSGYKTTDNMSNYFGRIYEARYLSGIVAGLKTETNKIGYVGAFAIPEVIRGINAFTLGAQSVNPDIEVEVVWTSTWYDPAKEKDAAVALLDNGCDIIAQHQDTAGPQQAAEERGLYSIGYHTDMSSSAPSANMTSAVWDWAPYYISSVQSVMDGTFESTSYWGGLDDKIVALSDLTEVAPADAQAEVDTAMAAILDGSLHVFEGPIVDQAGNIIVEEGQTMSDGDMLGMMWFVEGVIGNIE